MKLYYLTDDSDKSISPFFSPVIISASFICIVILAILFIIFWPWQGMNAFIGNNRTPISYFVTFSAALVINSYISLRCGRGEMSGSNYLRGLRIDEIDTYEKENDFFKYGFVEFLLHTIILILPFFPFFFLSASISGISIGIILKSLAVVFLTSLIFRLFGFMVYIFWGRTSLAGYFIARIFIFLLIILTGIVYPSINPIYIMYGLYRDMYSVGFALINPFSFYIVSTIIFILLLTFINFLLVRRNINKEKAA